MIGKLFLRAWNILWLCKLLCACAVFFPLYKKKLLGLGFFFFLNTVSTYCVRASIQLVRNCSFVASERTDWKRI